MKLDLSSLGWDEPRASGHSRLDRPDCQPARVARVHGGVCSVLASDGLRRVSLGGCILAAAANDPRGLPCPGDWVVVRTWPDGPTTVDAVLPRRTVLIGAADEGARCQALAANVDTAAVAVEPGYPSRDLGLIQWLLLLTRGSGATPLVVLTEGGRSVDRGRSAARIVRVGHGVSVCRVNTATGAGLAQLRGYVAPGRTLALLGRPGAGRSSLVDVLVGAEVVGGPDPVRPSGRARSGGGSRPEGGSRPTVRCRGLVPVPGGGAVIETTGTTTIEMRDGGYTPTPNSK